jgi:bifunctional N-acetylglucosamine-1-phosphate-uridyltransferase/glucosamine-1-phosphate-acetyltransferase GlmU-like protein
MTTADLYIVAAGNGSRMSAELPKALVPITDEPCLTSTLQQIGEKFRKVFVVTNVLARESWQAYFQNLKVNHPKLAGCTVNLQIESGLGDGHATLHGLIAAEEVEGAAALAQDIVVAWGDVFFPHAELIDELLAAVLAGSGLFPAVHEKHPYVALLVNEFMQCVSADFSKYGETHAVGYHDQSVFRFSRPRLMTSLSQIHSALWKGRRYITPGGELSLLYSFHQLFNAGTPAYVYETRYPTLSFNTVEEVAGIQREISARWKNRSQSALRTSFC